MGKMFRILFGLVLTFFSFVILLLIHALFISSIQDDLEKNEIIIFSIILGLFFIFLSYSAYKMFVPGRGFIPQFIETGTHDSGLSYTGFKKRFMASMIDLLIMIPILILQQKMTINSRFEYFFWTGVFFTLVYHLYTIICEGYTGQTVGRWITKIFVCSIDGTKAGFLRIFERYSVSISLSLLSMYMLWEKLKSIPEETFFNSTVSKIDPLVHTANQSMTLVSILIMIWTFSEYVVIYFNSSRRGLHDYLAGTVVLEKQ